jgi:hypothetical protein
VLTVPFDAFDQLASLRVNLGEGVHRVVLASVRIPVALDSSLDKCSKASSALSCVWNAVQVSLTTTVAFFDIASVLKNGLRLVKPSIYSRVHPLILLRTAHLWNHVIGTVVV